MRAPVSEEHGKRDAVFGRVDAHGVAVEVLTDHDWCRQSLRRIVLSTVVLEHRKWGALHLDRTHLALVRVGQIWRDGGVRTVARSSRARRTRARCTGRGCRRAG